MVTTEDTENTEMIHAQGYGLPATCSGVTDATLFCRGRSPCLPNAVHQEPRPFPGPLLAPA